MGKINYAMELEIVEGKGCQVHHTGQEFQYPEDIGNVCPWLCRTANVKRRTVAKTSECMYLF
jgi:hypothetical protein